MSFRVSGKNLDVGAALQDHARTKVNGIIGKYFGAEPSGHVTLEREGSGFRADMVLALRDGLTLQTEGRAHDIYASFDQAADRIEKRLRRHKRRLKDRHGPGGGAAPAVPAGTVTSYVIEAPEGEELAPDFSPVVVAEAQAPLRELSVSTAVLELDISGDHVLVFRHATTAQINVVYRRPDGHIGWIDPSGSSNRG